MQGLSPHPNIIFYVKGGIGKNIISTVLLKLLRQRYPDSNIVLVCSHPSIFKNNPNTNLIYNFDQLDKVWKKFILGKNVRIFAQEPYNTQGHILQDESIYESWANLLDLDYNEELPQIYLEKSEIDKAKQQYSSDKPIFVIHPFGGAVDKDLPYNWVRDIPPSLAQQIVDKYKDTHNVYQIMSPGQTKLENTIEASQNVRQIAILLQLADKTLLIDSFSQHLAACVRKESNVCWVGTNKDVFGYKLHRNIISEPPVIPWTFTCERGTFLSEPLNLNPWVEEKNVFNIKKIFAILNK